MASQKTQRRPKRPLLAGMAGAVVLALAALGFGLSPANADDTVSDPTVTEEVTTTETTDEVVEEDTSAPEETVVVPEETVAQAARVNSNSNTQEETPKKVFVCKYVGTPGVDETLQTGQNPISVSVNSIQNWDGTVPGYFSDAHDRSYVLEYDEGQEEPDVSECPDPDVPVDPTCIEDPTWSYTFDPATGSGVITVTGGEDGEELCEPLFVRAASWTYDTPASGSPSWPQTLNGYNDTTAGAIGAFNYGPPQLDGCSQYDVYASFESFDELELPTNLLGSHDPYEPDFLHEALNGFGPNPTYSFTSSEGCNPVVTPPTGEVGLYCAEDGAEFNAEATAGSTGTTFYLLFDGTLIDEQTAAAGETYGYSQLVSVLSSKGEGDSFTGELRAGDTLETSVVISSQEFTIDCVDPETPGVCTEETILPTSTNLNPRGAVLSANASYVDGGVLLESDNWVDAYVTFATNFELKDVRNFFMDITVADPGGAYGFAPIFHTSLGNIHGEELYSDELWTNSPGILPVTGGGQGGPYSGSLEDALAIGNPTVTSVTFLFTSATANSAILSQGGYNCLIQPFDYETAPVDPPKKTETLAATGDEFPSELVAFIVFAVGAGMALVIRDRRRKALAVQIAE